MRGDAKRAIVGLLLLSLLLCATQSFSGTGTLLGSGPSAPQNPGMVDSYGNGYNAARNYPVSATGGTNDRFANVDPATSLFVDPTGGNWGAALGPCRQVSNSATAPGPVEIPLANQTEWQYFRAGQSNGATPPGITELVCCRPQIVYLCANTQTQTLSYTAFQGTQTASATCSNGTEEVQTWTCGFTGVSATDVNADGVWQQTGDAVVQTCPSTQVCWNDPTQSYGCCGTLPVTPMNQSYTVVQVENPAKLVYYGGQITLTCGYLGPNWPPYGGKHPLIGTCGPVYCTGPAAWTVNGNSCSGYAGTGRNYPMNSTGTAYDDDPPPANSGTAPITCQGDGSWLIGPGATCAPGACQPQPGYGVWSICNANCQQTETDNCGNVIGTGSCTNGYCGTTPTNCAGYNDPFSPFVGVTNVPVYCNLHPYTCTSGPYAGHPFTDCGDSCTGNPAIGATGGGGYSSWTTNSCSCQNGSSPSCQTAEGPTCYVCN